MFKEQTYKKTAFRIEKSQIYVKELIELNYINNDSNIHDLTFNSKLRKIKISVEVF